jgi:hypothetical protein
VEKTKVYPQKYLNFGEAPKKQQLFFESLTTDISMNKNKDKSFVD